MKLIAHSSVIALGYEWFSGMFRNGLYRKEEGKEKVEFVGFFPGEKYDQAMLHGCIRESNNKLYFSPYYSRNVTYYNMLSKTFTNIPLKNMEIDSRAIVGNSNPLFWQAIKVENGVFMLGYSYPAILFINSTNDEIVYITDWINDLNKYIEEDEGFAFFTEGHFIEGKELWIPLGCCQGFLVLNLETLRCNIHRVKGSFSSISCTENVGKDTYFIMGRGKGKDKYALYDRKKDEINELHSFCIDEHYGDFPFHKPLYYNGKLFIIPINNAKAFIYDIHSKELYDWFDFNELRNSYNEKTPNFFNLKIVDSILSFCEMSDLSWNDLDLLNMKNKKRYYYENNLNYDDLNKLFSPFIEKNSIIDEKFYGLNNYLDWIKK